MEFYDKDKDEYYKFSKIEIVNDYKENTCNCNFVYQTLYSGDKEYSKDIKFHDKNNFIPDVFFKIEDKKEEDKIIRAVDYLKLFNYCIDIIDEASMHSKFVKGDEYVYQYYLAHKKNSHKVLIHKTEGNGTYFGFLTLLRKANEVNDKEGKANEVNSKEEKVNEPFDNREYYDVNYFYENEKPYENKEPKNDVNLEHVEYYYKSKNKHYKFSKIEIVNDYKENTCNCNLVYKYRKNKDKEYSNKDCIFNRKYDFIPDIFFKIEDKNAEEKIIHALKFLDLLKYVWNRIDEVSMYSDCLHEDQYVYQYFLAYKTNAHNAISFEVHKNCTYFDILIINDGLTLEEALNEYNDREYYDREFFEENGIGKFIKTYDLKFSADEQCEEKNDEEDDDEDDNEDNDQNN